MADNAYGRVLDYQGSGAECPPEDFYTWEVIDITDPVERLWEQYNVVNIESTATVKLVNYPYNPDDEDDYDWNGLETRVFAKLMARYPKEDENKEPIRNEDGSLVLKDPSPSWKSPKSTTRPFIEALFPEWDWTKEGLANRPLILDDFIGRRFRAWCQPNAKGYPSLSKYAKAGKGPRRPPVQTAPQQQLQRALEPDDQSIDDSDLLSDEP